MTLRNWSENVRFSAANVYAPRTVEELQEQVRASRKVSVLGSRHSFNDIAAIDAQIDTGRGGKDAAQQPTDPATSAYISLERLDHPVTIEQERNTVTCGANVTYGELCQRLHDEGVALRNTASLPHISVGGACATATHGSGDNNGNLASEMVGMELVTADGALRSLTRDRGGEDFFGGVVGLGGLGVVTRITLETVPAFAMEQRVYEDLPVGDLYDHFDEIMSSAYSVSLFTDWREGTVNQVWLKRQLGGWAEWEGGANSVENGNVAPAAGAAFFGARPAPTHRHPVTRFDPAPCTPQMGVPGPWHERLPHFRVDSTPASGDELQTEYFVAREHAVPALQAMEGLRDRFEPVLWISEVRSIAADRLWLSQSYETPTVALHFSWRKDWPAVRALLPVIEEALGPFQVRPHWGKLFSLSPAHLEATFSRMSDFRSLLRSWDPERKFRNGFIDRHIYGQTN